MPDSYLRIKSACQQAGTIKPATCGLCLTHASCPQGACHGLCVADRARWPQSSLQGTIRPEGGQMIRPGLARWLDRLKSVLVYRAWGQRWYLHLRQRSMASTTSTSLGLRGRWNRGGVAGQGMEAWPVELRVRGLSNCGLCDCWCATASVLRRRVRPEGRTVSPLEAGWASTSRYGIASRCDGFAQRRRRPAQRGVAWVFVYLWVFAVWVFVEAVCVCGVCMGVVSVFVGVDSVVGGLVCGAVWARNLWKPDAGLGENGVDMVWVCLYSWCINSK